MKSRSARHQGPNLFNQDILKIEQKSGIEKREVKRAAYLDEDRFKIFSRPPQERRTWKRFAVEGAIVAIRKSSFMPLWGTAYAKIGLLSNISMKGMAVHYVDIDGKKNITEFEHISIMLPEGGIVVDQISFKVVNRYKMADLPDGKELWRLCVAFNKLHPMQRIQLENFIDNYGNELENKLKPKAINNY